MWIAITGNNRAHKSNLGLQAMPRGWEHRYPSPGLAANAKVITHHFSTNNPTNPSIPRKKRSLCPAVLCSTASESPPPKGDRAGVKTP